MSLHQTLTAAQPFFLSLSLFFLTLYLVWFKKPKQHIKYNFPPSPWKLPIIGNLHQLGDCPHLALHSMAQKYGPLMLLHVGFVPTVVASTAEMAREIMKTHDLVFSSRPKFSIAKRLFYGKDIAFQPYNEYWRQARKVCVLQLLSVKKVQSFRFVREEEIACMIEKIKELSSSSLPVNLSKMFVVLTNSVICRVTVGKKYGEDEVGRRFLNLFKDVASLFGTFIMGDSIPSLAWVDNLNGLNAKVEKAFIVNDAFNEEVVQEHIDKRKKIGGGGGGGSEVEDFVDILLDIEKENNLGIPFERESIKAMISDMFGAGSDTTSSGIEWVMAELVKNPEIMKEVQEEIRGIAKGKTMLTEDDNIDSMHYFKAAIKEALRLHPPVPIISHASIEPTKLQGYDIPAKATVIVNAHSVGRDPKAWEEPEKFWPKRFMSGSGRLIDFKGLDYELIPFGAGRRGCPGTAFAMALIELALANLLNTFDWGLPDGMEHKNLDMGCGSGLVVHKKTNLVVTATPHYP